MAKTHKNLFPAICSLNNLHAAANRARRRRTRKESVERFELHRERFLRQLSEELVSGRWRPHGYRTFRIFDPKERLISAAPYRDRVVHHALCAVIGPLIEARFVYDTYSCRKGKGTDAARERCRRYTNRYGYVLKCDVRKYFQSVDHGILMEKIGRVVGCARTLDLCRVIVDSAQDEELVPRVFGGECPSEAAARRRGIPIGNLTSQIWANLYLDRLDHVIREELRVPGYARYTDDFLIWSNDRGVLHEARARIAAELHRDRLELHETKTRIMRCADGVPFLGFRFRTGLRPRLLGETKRRFEKRTRRQVAEDGGMTADAIQRSVDGWCAFARYGNVKGLFESYRRDRFGLAGQ